jgi:hypothetical protein
VVVVIVGVVKAVPVPREVPPDETAYQFKIPAVAVAPRTNAPVPQRESGVVELITGVIFTVATTAVLGEVQLPLETST